MDIDIQNEISEEDEALVNPDEAQNGLSDTEKPAEKHTGLTEPKSRHEESLVESKTSTSTSDSAAAAPPQTPKLATPAVRHLSKQLNIDISHVRGTGKDGRVLKEDLQNHASSQAESFSRSPLLPTDSPTSPPKDTALPLTPIQNQMFKAMTRSLSIPHFLYTHTVDLTNLTKLRRSLAASPAGPSNPKKVSALPFILKALSLSLSQHSVLNSHLVIPTPPQKPTMTHHSQQNIGIAIDTPAGLLVPVIHNLQELSVVAIAHRLHDLTQLARSNRLSPQDLAGGTFTVSNVGSIGGGVVSPVILEGQTGIVGVGRAQEVPAFGEDGGLVRREECVLSWSADHRVVDGATVARCAEQVRGWLEEPARMAVVLR